MGKGRDDDHKRQPHEETSDAAGLFFLKSDGTDATLNEGGGFEHSLGGGYIMIASQHRHLRTTLRTDGEPVILQDERERTSQCAGPRREGTPKPWRRHPRRI